ncbi:putative peptidoglycan binding protein [Herbihabitans rhizosphaerae]|uniref:Putative peptidoglycan binding protein n=1 Tax=Herbihabitans rhizosphaerae TaxID=1872711 RepID=A0A4Q7L2G0_9PSEU|nr:transglycosylase family protein [Herbihabitans rhizosphaerae]RZS43738.1 putative peptidoglycan binding protein [Herbihabitans rhizosphaerae]
MSGKRVVRGIAKLLLVAAAAAGIQVFVMSVSAAADPPRHDWSKLRACEASGRYNTNTGNGYYGAYQFDLSTWRSVKGAGLPHQASSSEQDYRALYLYRMRGWQPWECADGKHLALRNDRDARSKVVPSRADSAYIGGHVRPPAPPRPPVPPSAPAAWPGKVYAFGDCDEALKAFQLRMNAFGYDFQGSGCYYQETHQAVLDLQRANHIRDSGRLGPKTWKAAFK